MVQDQEKGEVPVKQNRFIFWVRRIFLLLFILIALVVLLLQSSQVQTWLTSKITKYISEATNTTVTARRVKISPFDGVILNDLSIIDFNADTLLYGGAINISLRKNIFYLFNNKLDLSYIGLKDFKLNIITELDSDISNLQRFLNNLSTSNAKSTNKAPLDFKLKEIDLSNIFVKIENKNKGNYQVISLTGGNLDINYLDWECMDFDLNGIILNRPSYRNHIYQYECSVKEELAVSPKPDETTDLLIKDSNPITLTLRSMAMVNGFFGLTNELIAPDKEHEGKLDYQNFYFDKINLGMTDVRYQSDAGLTLNINTLSATDNTGFQIKNIACDSFAFDTRSLSIPSYVIEIGRTKIKNKVSLSFADLNSFSDFANKVVINAVFKDTRIYLEDLEHFVKSIGNISFVKNNRSEFIDINGRYYGKISNLAGRDVDIKMGDKLSIAGSFNTRNLLDANNTVLNVKLDRFQTSMRKIKMIMPSFNMPVNFNKLGSINFAGRFDGYLEDFVAYGKLNTDLGSAEMDMRLDLSEGVNKANYSGNLNLKNFNLGKWSDNPDFGLVNFNSKVDDGKGLTLNTVKTDVAAQIKDLTYKKYIYKDFTLDGIIDKNTFNGNFKISDPNIDFVFNGSFEYLNDKAFLNFTSEVKNIDLQALNISESPLSFSGKMAINTVGNNINDFTGNFKIQDLLMHVKDSMYFMKEIAISSRETVKGSKSLSIESDIGSVNLDGEYDIPNIVKSVKKVIYSNYPYITKAWKKEVASLNANQKFDFSINISDSRNYLSLLGLNNSNFRRLSLKGRLDTYRNDLSIASTIPQIRINKDSISDLQLLVTSNSKAGDILLHIDSTFAGGKHFNPIDIQTNLKGDTINFEFSTEKLIDSLADFDIKGRLIPHAKGYSLHLADDLLVMLGTKWKMNNKNNIVIGDKYLGMEDVILSDGLRSIEVNDINNNKGLTLDITNFDFDLINGIIKYDKMKFAGITNVSAKIMDVYSSDLDITGYVNIPKFTINGDPYGSVHIDVTKLPASPVKASIAIGDFLAINGSYDVKEKKIDSKIKLREAPMTLIQYLLKDGISDTKGYIDADILFGGHIDNPEIKGDGMVHEGKTKIKFTGTTYYFDKQKVRLSNTEISLDGAVLKDDNGNTGIVRGGLYHQTFRNFGVNATISGNNVIGLNTTKADNPDYYGYGIGQLSAEFKGSFDKIDMKISAVTGPGTKLFIPVDKTQGTISQSFIKFVKKDEIAKENKKNSVALGGINVEMTLTLTPDAEVSIIFNEAKGDIIRGTGRGNMKIDITRQGDFEIFGDYEIERGEYLFTVALLPVAKPFVVERGGIIKWTGDPLNTSLDITANYRTRTAIKPFIEEYLALATPVTQQLAEQRTEVDLRLKLGGTLYKPEIRFDLSFPNLTGDLASYAESKLRLLRTNQLELNSQVLGLIVIKSFLPSNRVSDVFGAAGLQSAGINTLSEFISAQLSLYITNVLNSALEEQGLLSGIDFELGMRNNNFGVASAATSKIFPDEIEVRLKNKFRFMDERLSLNVGGNYVFQNKGLAVNQVLPDFSLELVLTDDRKLKVRLYGKGDLDPINNTSLRQKYGLGVAYRTEFGSMLDFEQTVKKSIGEIIEK